ncbi:unnamed protein product [Tenebrio molitor]|jgi:hypothetical protein|nr:unnamed protein product [Tenebrio molitor]
MICPRLFDCLCLFIPRQHWTISHLLLAPLSPFERVFPWNRPVVSPFRRHPSFLKDIIEFSFPQGRLTDRSFLSEFDQSKSLIHASCESRKTNPVVCLFSCGRREKEIMESCFSPKRERLTRLFVAMENK